jgi:hypothetical protein
MHPLVLEQMPASPDGALAVSRDYVERADFYLGSLLSAVRRVGGRQTQAGAQTAEV